MNSNNEYLSFEQAEAVLKLGLPVYCSYTKEPYLATHRVIEYRRGSGSNCKFRSCKIGTPMPTDREFKHRTLKAFCTYYNYHSLTAKKPD
jgi:hypothetical protein